MAGAGFILLCTIAALLGPLILPDDTPDSNRQNLEIESQPPGFRVEMLRLKGNPAPDVSLWEKWLRGQPSGEEWLPVSGWRISGEQVVYHPFSPEGTPPLPEDSLPLSSLTPNPPTTNNEQRATTSKPQTPNPQQYLLGTDRYGRDMLSRLLLGARVSLAVGSIAVLLSLLVGVSLGAIAGYYRGWADSIIQWMINVVWSLPTLLLVMAITLALGRGFWQIFVAVGLSMWVEAARLVRGQILVLRNREYVQAGRALGYRGPRLLFRHILPNVLGPVTVVAAANFASAILLEAGLSFLGIGIQPPAPSWGAMLQEHAPYLLMDAPYLAILPGTAIMLLVLAFNLLGNGLRDALDVRMR